MYNRYIPQSDGSFQRNQVPEQRGTASSRQNGAPARRTPDAPSQPVQQVSPLSFLKTLLPKDFDTADLLIVLLLLLMAGDNHDNQNNAILTLALYLFL